MSVIRPPVTGDIQLDSWMDSVSRQANTATQAVAVATTAISGLASGVNAVTLVLYKRSNNDPMQEYEYLSVDTRFNYSTNILKNLSTQSTIDFDGWTREVPPTIEGQTKPFLYSIQVNIADSGDVETIPSTNWSSPIIIQRNEVYNNANVLLYQRTDSQTPPANPQGDLTYNFETGTYTRTVYDNWVDFENVGEGKYLWMAVAFASSLEAQVTISTNAWGVGILAGNGTDGLPGDPGDPGAPGVPAGRLSSIRLWYKNAANIPPTFDYPTATITWADNSITLSQDSINNGWTSVAPTLDADGSTVAYFSDLVFSDPTGEALTTFTTGSQAQRTINFDGIVTFTNVTNGIANTVTYIDGGNVVTVKLHADTIDVDSLTAKTLQVVGDAGYLTETEFAAGVLLYPSANKALPTDSAFLTRFGRDPIVNDVMYVKDTNYPYDYTTYIRRAVAPLWEEFVVAVHGDLLVSGTVVADSIQVGITPNVGRTYVTSDGVEVQSWNGSQYITRVKLGKL